MVGAVQEHLEAIYGIKAEERATRFLVGAEMAKALGATGRSGEELLVREEDGELQIALFIAQELLEKLARFSERPLAEIIRTELSAYCQVAEGVSHFLYLGHVASQERTVSLLELEAQAEVDKFAVCALAGWSGSGRQAAHLHRRLFDEVSYNPALSGDERHRYVEANRLSRNFCRRLLPHVMNRQLDRFLGALRYAYRLGAEAKLRHLAAPA